MIIQHDFLSLQYLYCHLCSVLYMTLLYIYDSDVCPLIVITIFQVQRNGLSGHCVWVAMQLAATDLSFQAFPSSTIFYLTLLTRTFTLFFMDRITSTCTLFFLNKIASTFTLFNLTLLSDPTYFSTVRSGAVKELRK